MAVTREVSSLRHAQQRIPQHWMTYGAYAVTALLALFALYVVMSHVVAWGQVRLDDLRYGRPRTFHLEAPLPGGMTHFVAMNLDRQIVVLEISGSDLATIRTHSGPYLFGTGEDLTPVHMRMEDVNHDHAADLVLQVKNEEVVYLNRGSEFSLMTPEERAGVLAQQSH